MNTCIFNNLNKVSLSNDKKTNIRENWHEIFQDISHQCHMLWNSDLLQNKTCHFHWLYRHSGHNFNIADSCWFLPYKREIQGKSGVKMNKNISSPHPGQVWQSGPDILQTLAVEILSWGWCFFSDLFRQVTSANKLLVDRSFLRDYQRNPL